MFERMSSGFSLARSSWDVLRNDRKLLLFPFLSGLGCTLVMIVFLIPTVILAQNGGLVKANGDINWMVAGPLLFLYYLANYFVVIFCNAARAFAAPSFMVVTNCCAVSGGACPGFRWERSIADVVRICSPKPASWAT